MGRAAQQGGDRIDDGLLTLLAENAASGRPCALATVVRTESPTSAHPGDKAVITADGELHGWIGGSCSDALVRREALVAMSDGLPRLVRIRPDVEALETRNGGELTVATTCPSGGTLDIFIDPHLPRPLLVVIGASPAARTLDRARSCASASAPAPSIPVRMPRTSPGRTGCSTASTSARIAQEKDCWVVVATMGHYDDDALEAALTPDGRGHRAGGKRSPLRRRGGHAPGARHDRCAACHGACPGRASGVPVRRRRSRSTRSPRWWRSDTSACAANRGRAPAALAGFAVDPVCGMTVDTADAAHSATHEEQTYFFCCSACREQFVADPARFLRATAG